MAKYKRHKTKYPGVFYIEGKHVTTGKPEKVFYIRYRRDGKMVEEKAGRQQQNKMTEAKANKLRSLRADGDQGSNANQRAEKEAAEIAERGRWTISKLWAEYKAQRVENKGLKVDENRFKLYLEPIFGKKAPSEVITLDVDRVRIKLLKSKSPQTVKHVLALLRRVINFGIKKGLCPAPDASKLHIEFPPVDNQKTEDLTPGQLKALMKAIDEDPNRQVANLMKMALYTGMRRGELFKLKWRDVNFTKGFIHIRAPKGGRDQSIPLNDAARSLLGEHERTGSEFVFPGRNGQQRTDANHQTSRIKKRAGLPKAFRALHGLRHVYASMLASSGKVDIYTLQKLLTHKSAAMTQRYAHLRDETLQRASAVADDIFNALKDDKKPKVVNLDDHRE
jgi:integrase